tara:strand:- start:17265 stop:18851 length:1587 start_codon:yes stop_codon:yes gene_type:complete
MTSKVLPPRVMAKWIATISSYTMISRVLGFLRDILIAESLGAGPIADVFFVAFKFPNFFRRLFAEGAFNSAFVPLFAKELEIGGRKRAQEFAEEVVSVLLPSLVFLVALAQILMPWIMYGIAPGFSNEPEKFDLAIDLTRITFQYILFISIVSMLGGVLNSLYKFSAVASTPIILNICIILSLEFLSYLTDTPGHALAIGVSAAGILQFLWLFIACERAGISIRLKLPKLSPRVKRLLLLAAPVAVGAGIAQINLLIDIIIASFLPEGAVSFLYYADRISQLPLGVVGVAVGTALLPLMSRQLRSGKKDAAIVSQNRALEGALLLTVPATVAITILAEPIIKVLFERGEFGSDDTLATSSALLVYGAGLPAFVLIKVLVPGFFAREDTKTPVLIAIFCLFINIIANIILMGPLGHVGIAVATSIAGWINALLLGYALLRQGSLRPDVRLIKRTMAILLASGIMGVIIWFISIAFSAQLESSSDVKIGILVALILIGIVSYFFVAWVLGAFIVSDVRSLFKKNDENLSS